MIVRKLDMITEATTLSNPRMYDIRDVRAVAKKMQNFIHMPPMPSI